MAQSNDDLVSVLEYIEREKGISRATLVEAVQAALVSAARKSAGCSEEVDVQVEIDPETMQYSIFADGEELADQEFGRIAAQTAKQVIIQKIREAERVVIHEEYQHRIGEIVNGTVHRFERGAIVIDLGRTEGILTRREQIFNEEYRQGDRIRALVLEVNEGQRGPMIVLSRRHPNLVKRLFEVEVPEIFEAIVEIKSVAREPGERTKIAVRSKEERVDAVGACVGMRGTRVKNVVRELNGEKVDIVRHSENIVEFMTAALNPAEVASVKVFEKLKRVEVVVDDDMLSLAIGKRGQNVRLASKLTGWDIDIRSRTEVEARMSASLSQISGVGAKTRSALEANGWADVSMLASATVEALCEVPGVGPATAVKIIEAAKELLMQVTEEARAARAEQAKVQAAAVAAAQAESAQVAAAEEQAVQAAQAALSADAEVVVVDESEDADEPQEEQPTSEPAADGTELSAEDELVVVDADPPGEQAAETIEQSASEEDHDVTQAEVVVDEAETSGEDHVDNVAVEAEVLPEEPPAAASEGLKTEIAEQESSESTEAAPSPVDDMGAAADELGESSPTPETQPLPEVDGDEDAPVASRNEP